MMQINNRISVSLSSEEMAQKMSPEVCQEGHATIEPCVECNLIETAENIVSFSLEEFFHFDAIVQNTLRRQAHRVTVFAGLDPNRQTRTLMLLGCHMVMSQGMGFEEAFLIFRPLRSLIQNHLKGISAFEILLRAICCAKCLNWINFGLSGNIRSENCIHMDEFIHYARLGDLFLLTMSS